MSAELKVVTCCYGDCTTALVTVESDRATIIEPHAICGQCRTIILCDTHFSALSKATPVFACPTCSADQWEVVAQTLTDSEPVPAFGCVPVFAHAYTASTRLFQNAVTVQDTPAGSRVCMLNQRIQSAHKGHVLGVALSPSTERLAIIFDASGERVLEVYTDTGRPWRQRSDDPLGVDAVCFIDENRLAVLMCRHEGSLELVELTLEGGHMVSGRRLCATSATMPIGTCAQIKALDSDHVITVACSGTEYWLDTIQIATGDRIERIALPYLPSVLRVGPNGHILLGQSGGPISIVKAGQLVELFSHYDLVDAMFLDEAHLCLSTSSQALQINLESGASVERHWGHAVLGITKR